MRRGGGRWGEEGRGAPVRVVDHGALGVEGRAGHRLGGLQEGHLPQQVLAGGEDRGEGAR